MNATFQPAFMPFVHQIPQQEFSAQYFISTPPNPILTLILTLVCISNAISQLYMHVLLMLQPHKNTY